MAVYMIVDITVNDPSAYEEYTAKVPALSRKYGGEYLVRGGNYQALEGDWRPGRVIVSRFPDRASVEAFLNDPEYQPLKNLRHRVAKTNIIVIEGL